MDIKKLLTGGIIGGILFFALGYLIYGVMLMSFMEKHVGIAGNVNRAAADMQFPYLILGNLLSGFLVAYIFIRANVKNAADGVVTAGIFGFLMVASFDCMIYATSTIMSRTMMAADIAAATVMSAIIGGVLGFVMNMGNKKS